MDQGSNRTRQVTVGAVCFPLGGSVNAIDSWHGDVSMDHTFNPGSIPALHGVWCQGWPAPCIISL